MSQEFSIGPFKGELTEAQSTALSVLLFAEREVAGATIGSSVRTLDFHVAEILRRLGAKTVQEIRGALMLEDPDYRNECRKLGAELFCTPDSIKLSPMEFKIANCLFLGLSRKELSSYSVSPKEL